MRLLHRLWSLRCRLGLHGPFTERRGVLPATTFRWCTSCWAKWQGTYDGMSPGWRRCAQTTGTILDPERPHLYVEADYNPDRVRTFYEVPQAISDRIQPEGDRRTFAECLAALLPSEAVE